MKKLIKYILITIIIVIAIPSKQTSLVELVKEYNFSNATYSYYTTKEVSNKDASVIKNGMSYIIETNLNNVYSINSNLKDIDGESINYTGTYHDYVTLCACLLEKVCFTEELSNIKTMYGYNKKLSKSVKIDNSIINIQIAYSNGKITIGTPVILGSY